MPYWSINSKHKEDELSKIIRLFKRGGQEGKSAGLFLGDILFEYVKKHTEIPNKSIDCIIPIPPNKERLTQRGYNPPGLIAEILSKNLNIPLFSNALYENGKDTDQKNASNRAMNVYKKYHVSVPEQIQGRNIIVIDDVITTGSTLSECGRVLKNAGAGSLYALTLAKTMYSPHCHSNSLLQNELDLIINPKEVIKNVQP